MMCLISANNPSRLTATGKDKFQQLQKEITNG